MTDEGLDEVQGDAPDASAPPVPEVGSSSAAGSTEFDVATLAGDLNAFKADVQERLVVLDSLDELVDARFKSGKDKRYAKVEEIHDWVKRSGGDFESIQGDLEISELRQRLNRVEGADGDGGTSPVETQDDMTRATVDILDANQIAYNDPEYLQFAANAPAQPVDNWKRALNVWAKGYASKQTKAGGVTTATAAIESGVASTPGAEEESLQEELTGFYAGNHGSLTKPENIKRIKEISAELDKLSPPVNA